MQIEGVKKIAFLICAKNCSKDIDETIFQSKRICSLFKNSIILIAENDSIDDTSKKIKEYSNKGEVKYFNFDGLDSQLNSRTQRLAFLRNFLLNKVKDECDYVIISDADSVLKNFDLSGIINSFCIPLQNWDVIGANCNDRYYDVWTLRTKTFDYNCWDLINHKRQAGVHDLITIPSIIAKNQVAIPKNKDLIEVDSCFGGLAIYKSSSIKDAEYDGKLKNCECLRHNILGKCIDEISEHVPFNKKIKENGGKIFINPKLIINCQTEHLMS